MARKAFFLHHKIMRSIYSQKMGRRAPYELDLGESFCAQLAEMMTAAGHHRAPQIGERLYATTCWVKASAKKEINYLGDNMSLQCAVLAKRRGAMTKDTMA